MTVFKIRSDEAYSLVYHDVKQLSLKTPDRKALLRGLSSNTSVKNFWVESEGILEGKQPIPDISRLSGFDMVVSPRAYNTLQPVLAGYGEFLVVPFKGEIYYLFRCLNRVDKVDPDNSSLNEYNEAIGLKFLPGDVEGQLIWATTYGVTRGLFCGAELKKIVQDAGLTGLVFDEKLTSWVP